MAKRILREQAIQLRLQGKTYGQIKRELGIQKSTLSGWLRKLPLTDTQQEILSKNREMNLDLGREKYRETRQKQRLERLQKIFSQQENALLPLTARELFLAGVFLYWGEGEKTHGVVSISNTDPRVVVFALLWMTKSLKIPKEKIKIQLHLYKDMDSEDAINFWSKKLAISKEQFRKPYIKKSNREGLTYKSFGHGTCKLYFGSVLLSEKIAMSIKAISGFYGAKDTLFWYN
ncbi:MAG TPA: hypothetical protein VLF68_02795 [Candidatus Saccharimonadales bacterium]|nr:hypothetical protein [Candidatus Saccharimonadales bacterium]